MVAKTGADQTTKSKRQDERNGESDGDDFADQKPVDIDRRGETDAPRKPNAHQRRHDRLHD
jgi:hypothetical protein